MGWCINFKTNVNFHENYFKLTNDDIKMLSSKSIEVDYFDKGKIVEKLKCDERFKDLDYSVVDKVLRYFNSPLYKKTRCLCSEDLNLCIINKNYGI